MKERNKDTIIKELQAENNKLRSALKIEKEWNINGKRKEKGCP